MTSSVMSICFWLMRPFGSSVDEGQQRAESERVQQHVDVAVAAELLADIVERRGALVGVGGVDVEEDGVLAGGLHFVLDSYSVGQRGAQVEVDAEDAVAGAGEVRRRWRRRSRSMRRGPAPTSRT